MSYLSGNIAYTAPTTLTPRTALTPLQRTFGVSAPTFTFPAPRPVSVVPVKPSVFPVSKPAVTPPSPFSPASQPSTAPGVTSVNVSVSGGGGASPVSGGSDASVAPEVGTMSAGMFGLNDVNPQALVFLAMAALVVFMESGNKKGRR